MKRQLIHILIGVITLLPLTTLAQDGGLGGDTTFVVKDKIPIVEEAEKQIYPGKEPEYQKEKVPIKYETPVSLLPVSYEAPNIRPLAVSKEKPQKYPGSYVKLGFGTQFSPLAEARHTGRILKKDMERMNYGIYFRHFSGYGQKIKNQRFGQNHAAVYGSYYTEKVRLSARVDYERNSNHYYGYNHSDTSFTSKQTKQFYDHVGFTADLGRADVSKALFDYYGKVNVFYFKDRFKQNEFDANVLLKFQKVFKEKHFVFFDIKEDYSTFKNDVITINRNVFGAKPKYEFNDQVWKIFAGADFVWENNIFHVLPDLGLERSLFKEYLVTYNGWKMELRRFGFREMSQRNPWVNPNTFDLKHTRFEERYTGFKGMIKKFSYDLKFSQYVSRRTALFVNDTTDMSKFNVIYTRGRMSVLNPHAEMAVRVNTDLEFMLTGDYFMYELEDQDKAWHMPSWSIDFFARYTIGKKVFLQLNFFVMDGLYAKLPGNQIKKLQGTYDINIAATYKFSKHFSFFANLNNLASVKFEPYYNYPTYGFNCLAGVIFTYN